MYGNPSSVHSAGQEVKAAIDEARQQVADAIGCESKEIYFTAGGSESDNWAIKGVAKKYASKGKHIISSKIEHHAVLHTLDSLKKDGYEITLLDVDSEGFIDLEEQVLSSPLPKSVRSQRNTRFSSTQMQFRLWDMFP